MLGNKRKYHFRSDNSGNEKRLFWILSILVSLIFIAIYYWMK
jgi:hypothetical protein